MNVVIVHGIFGRPGVHWQQWLADELTAVGHTVSLPAMPDPDRPDRGTWLRFICTEIASLSSEDTVIVGHSLGVVSALDYAEQARSRLRGLVSVAGFGADYDSELNSYFLAERSVDFERVKSNIDRAVVFYGDDDPYVTQAALRDLADQLVVTPRVISGGKHLNTEAGFSEFPLLLDAVMDLSR